MGTSIKICRWGSDKAGLANKRLEIFIIFQEEQTGDKFKGLGAYIWEPRFYLETTTWSQRKHKGWPLNIFPGASQPQHCQCNPQTKQAKIKTKQIDQRVCSIRSHIPKTSTRSHNISNSHLHWSSRNPHYYNKKRLIFWRVYSDACSEIKQRLAVKTVLEGNKQTTYEIIKMYLG